MNSVRLTLLAITALIIAALSDQAFAQSQRGPNSRPTTSPYLDLTRQGDTATNYYRRVKPELEFRSAIAGQQREINQLERRTATRQDSTGQLPGTGHGATFMSLSHFFGSRSR